MKHNEIAKAHGYHLREYGWWKHDDGTDIMRKSSGVWWKFSKTASQKFTSLKEAVTAKLPLANQRH